ncbi:GGDEF domain-containing protein [Candidatus Magnetominusculus xianensis]|uniref:diguanylate cyclase n=1 Tax=Candidatus Magnetominusculus xianensis TaxID=1748249 RepID=A0ABR5SHT6_9BACT|nr:GGDEF domain-containing protein [Candidatus Magnetominusculus xianensis]KWT91777.1 diguanylate cyclase [Candidatus Magnetominusculus xianensis]MBF0404847.1 diguanylate cyclase [Nitrospirota bacterium]
MAANGKRLIDRLSGLVDLFVDIIAFRNLEVRWRILLFYFATLLWFVVFAAIGISNLISFSYNIANIEKIARQDKAGQIITRKIRGINISARDIALFNDPHILQLQIEKGRNRLEEVHGILKALADGGHVRDSSNDVKYVFDQIQLVGVSEDRVFFVSEIKKKALSLGEQFEHLVTLKSEESKGEADRDMILKKVQSIDKEITDMIVVLGDFSLANSRLIQSKKDDFTYRIIKFSVAAILVSLLTAWFLLSVYLLKLYRSIMDPIKMIISYIRQISAGGFTISSELSHVGEKGEIGELFRQFKSFTDWFININSFKQIIEEDSKVDDVFFRLAVVLEHKIDITNFTIYGVQDKNSLAVIHKIPQNTPILCNKEILSNRSQCRALKTGHNISSDEYADICRQFLCPNDKGYFCVPMLIHGRSMAVVQLVFDKGSGHDVKMVATKISTALHYIAASLSAIGAKKLQNELKELSTTDALTGLNNRRYLEQYVEIIVSGVLRRKTTIAILMCDIDFFKQVNDTYGHDAGDTVLKTISEVLRGGIRNSDIIVRYGGEEFLMILHDVEGSIETMAENIRKKIEGTQIPIGQTTLKKTISIGISEFPTDSGNFFEAVKYADIALYQAKQTGRNKLVRFTPDMLPDMLKEA